MQGRGLSGAAEDEAFDDFIKALLIDPTPVTSNVLNEIRTLYPANDSANGGKFNTGDSLFDRAEAWYTDNMFLSPRRMFFEKAATTQTLFAYFFQEFIPGNNIELGGMYSLRVPEILPYKSRLITSFPWIRA